LAERIGGQAWSLDCCRLAVLWHVPVEEALVSAVFMIDLRKNGDRVAALLGDDATESL
jgi:hypothetical protein